MELYVTGRGGGKTHLLIEWAEDCEKNNIEWTIIVANAKRKRYLTERAPHLPADRIRTPGGVWYSKDVVAVDDLDSILYSMFGNVDLATATDINVDYGVDVSNPQSKQRH